MRKAGVASSCSRSRSGNGDENASRGAAFSPGMTADIFIRTGERTFLGYLLDPPWCRASTRLGAKGDATSGVSTAVGRHDAMHVSVSSAAGRHAHV